MSLPLPNLDNRRFDDLFEEMKSYIHRYAPDWTDHNLSDPGITILEVLVWLSEVVMYRANQIPEDSITNFLSIIRGGLDGMTGTQDEEIEKALMDLEQRYRAITASDFEELVEKCSEDELSKDDYKCTVARSVCIANRNLSYESANESGHISVVVFLQSKSETETIESEDKEQCKEAIETYLSSRRLITTHVHVVSPDETEFFIDFDIELAPKSPEKTVLMETIKDNMESFFDGITGGYDGKGWPIGRDIYIADVYKIIEETSGVEHAKWAKIVPSNQLLKVSFESAIEFTDSLDKGSRIIQWNNNDIDDEYRKVIRSFATVEKINGGESRQNLLAKGFSSGDIVSLTTKTVPHKKRWVRVLSVSTSPEGEKWKILQLNTEDLNSENITFSAGSIIESEDGAIKTVLENDIEITAGDTETVEVTVSGLISGTSVSVLDSNGLSVLFKNGDEEDVLDAEFSSFERFTERMVLDIPAVPVYSREHN